MKHLLSTLIFLTGFSLTYGQVKTDSDLVFEKVRPGGFIIADNVLWSGRVLDDVKDENTRALHDYNQKVLGDDRVANVLLPIRDGLMIARKK